MVQVSVTSKDIAAVGAAVRKLGDGRTIVNEMTIEIRQAVPPIRKAIRDSALASLPSAGGLNRWVAKAGVRASVNRGPRTAGVNLVAGRNSARRRSDLKALDRSGRLRHPLFGNRGYWFTQRVKPGWFSEPAAAQADDFRDVVTKAVNAAARKVGL